MTEAGKPQQRTVQMYTQWLQTMKKLYWWAGWGSGLDPHTLVKTAPAVLKAA